MDGDFHLKGLKGCNTFCKNDYSLNGSYAETQNGLIFYFFLRAFEHPSYFSILADQTCRWKLTQIPVDMTVQ